jgi:hypothetical protein
MSNETTTYDPLGNILAALDERPPELGRARRKPPIEALDVVLKALRLGHHVVDACQAAGVAVSTVYYTRKMDRAFGRAFDSARAMGIEARAERKFHAVA